MGVMEGVFSACQKILGAPLTASAGGPYTVDEGGEVPLIGTCSKGPDAAKWDLDADGQYDDASGLTPTFSAQGIDGPAQRAISFSCDKDLRGSNITIANAAPKLMNSPPVTGRVGQPYVFNLEVVDPGGDVVTLHPGQERDGRDIAYSSHSVRWENPVEGSHTLSIVLRDHDQAETRFEWNVEIAREDGTVVPKPEESAKPTTPPKPQSCGASGLGLSASSLLLTAVALLRRRRRVS
jgi:hypothetical protein